MAAISCVKGERKSGRPKKKINFDAVHRQLSAGGQRNFYVFNFLGNFLNLTFENFEKPPKTSKTSPKLFIEEKGKRSKSKFSFIISYSEKVNNQMTTENFIEKWLGVFKLVEGGNKGEQCKDRVNKAIRDFFEIGIKRIEEACNQERKRLLDNNGRELESRIKKCNPNLKNCNFRVAFEVAKCEIEPEFKLTEPDRIEIYIRDQEGPSDEGRPAAHTTIDNKLEIYLRELDFLKVDLKDELVWKGYYICDYPMTIEDVIFHELFHTCGDRIHDGIRRYNHIGVIVVRTLLRHRGYSQYEI